MANPKVSIIIPAYNNAIYLGEAINSCLAQTYTNIEVMVVNDASPDNTTEVVKAFKDDRIKYILHKKNKGLSAARNTGIRASTGEYIALLDGDDIFHPKKVELHVDYLEKHPEIGVTYNPRFELNHSAKTIRELWRPPLTVTLMDLVFGFPFGPSDMVLRREWAFQVKLFNESYIYVGEDLDINCRLALAGCKFASVDRALNYRRYYSDRVISDLPFHVSNTLQPLMDVFNSPNCPDLVLELKDRAISSHLLLWSVIAFLQEDTALGQEYCISAVRGNPSILNGSPSILEETIINYSIVDESKDHNQILRRVLDQLPAEFATRKENYDGFVARGYLLRGVRAIMWGRLADGKDHFARARSMGARFDRALLGNIVSQLLSFEAEFGQDAAQEVIRNLSIYLEEVGGRILMHSLNSNVYINQAFTSFSAGDYANTARKVISAAAEDPKYLSNRGVLSILFRSIIHSLFQPAVNHNPQNPRRFLQTNDLS